MADHAIDRWLVLGFIGEGPERVSQGVEIPMPVHAQKAWRV
jgi:hypothetical protein